MKSGKILVVDDEQDLRAIIRIILEDEGWGVLEAENGAEALDHDLTQVALILCDVIMPVMSGLDLLNSLKERKRPKFILMTAFSELKGLNYEAKINADDVLIKPFTSDQLIASVNRVMASGSEV